jgi:hypothetical protein
MTGDAEYNERNALYSGLLRTLLRRKYVPKTKEEIGEWRKL